MELKELLKGKLSEEELELVHRGFDLVGDIAIVQLPEDFEKKEVVAEAIVKVHKRVKTVCNRIGKIENEERIPKIEVIWGDGTETIHKENNCLFKLDISKVFFTPRMQSERKRVIGLVKEGEKVLDMFAGVGPFSIPISKKAEVTAIDINPWAVKYLRENAKLNRVELKIYEGDCKEVVEREKISEMDRIIMNYPKGSLEYLPVAKKAVKKGGIIHLYTFEKEGEEKEFDLEVLGKRKCGEVAPRLFRVVYDLRK